jgi:uncharacterized protein
MIPRRLVNLRFKYHWQHGDIQPPSCKILNIVLLFLTIFFASCTTTYYQASVGFNKDFEAGNLTKALQTLKGQSGNATGKDRFLYFVNKGLVLSMMGQYEESNDFFEKAYLFWEDFKVNYFSEGASYLINSTITTYRGEDHEHLILLYYKALNYLKMQKTQEALVECRRLNIRLQQLSDRYSSGNSYKHDAFINNLMGIIYEADKDYNNAFIAYRNAYESYQNEYESMFQVSVPHQLKLDLLRTAWLTGLKDEWNEYKMRFDMPNYEYVQNEGGELIFFWHNGLAPYKVEWGINFLIDRESDQVVFANRELGMSFTFPRSGYSEEDWKGLSRLEFFRVAFPKYIERAPYFQEANLKANGVKYNLELTENLNKIAFKVLDERMGHEFSKALIRVALKKVSEYSLKKENKSMGALLGLFNALTEKADTRNWQTLPHSIYYARVPLPVGQTTLTLTLQDRHQQETIQTYTYDVKNGQVLYHTFSSLESDYPNYGN